MALFNIKKGKYDKAVLRQNSLVENALQRPDVYSAMIRLRDQYGFTYLTEGTGRVKMLDTKETEFGNNSVEWFIKGRGERPSTVAGPIHSGAGTKLVVLPVNEDYLNKKEIVKFHSGKMAMVKSDAFGSGPYMYEFECINYDEENMAQYTITAADVPVGSQISLYSNLNEEKSKKGYGSLSYPDKYTQFMSIHRRELTVSGSSLSNIAWVENTKTKKALWYFEAEDEVEKQMFAHVDRWRLYGERTVDSEGRPFLTIEGKPIIAGDGVLKQISGINDWSFSNDSDINRKNLSDYIGYLASKATEFDNNHWVVMTGMRGQTIFHQLFESSMIDNGNMAYSYAHGKEIEMGGNFTSYRVGTNTISLVRAAIFDDEYLHSQRDSEGNLVESSRMVFLNYGRINNESNIMIGVRKGPHKNRGMIKKYVPGMVDPYNVNPSAISGNLSDGFDVGWLSESCALITNPFACGQWIRKAV